MKIWLLIGIIYFITNINLYSTYDGIESNVSQKNAKPHSDREVLIVSTLNGILHGIDIHDGKSLWTIPNSPLVSQSLSNLEFIKDEKKYRLIPSLEGQLYMLEVESKKKGLHALPINADALFTSSFQLSSDSLLVGGKEQRVLGFNPFSGEIKYRCSKDGCQQASTFQTEKESCDLLLCRRVNHIVRAVDIDSGHEKWNFSVGQDEIITANSASYPRSPAGQSVEENVVSQGGCVMSAEDDSDKDDTIQWSFNVEEGSVQLSSRAPFKMVRWRKELGASLSRVWLLRGRSVHPLSIFARDSHSHLEHASDESGCPIRRSLFLGAHEGHLYVQLEDGSARRSPRPAYVALPSSEQPETSLSSQVTTTRHRVSKVTRYAPPSSPQYGFFRPSMHQDESEVSKKWFPFQDNNECYPYTSEPLVVRFGSFLFQKIVFVGLVLLVGHLVFKKLYLPYQMSKLVCDGEPMMVVAGNNKECVEIVSQHMSRYESDYEHIRCLGRGAFGVVFEARHRVDQYHYAVKRVRVRNSPRARDKLLQEVQAFAHLEHPGIVRYYQAWFELPPDGWQEQRDRDLSLTKSSADNSDQVISGSTTDTSATTSQNTPSSLTCADSSDGHWSTSSVLDWSTRDGHKLNRDSIVIFDRSMSVGADQSQVAPSSCLWAHGSYASSISSDHSLAGSTGPSNYMHTSMAPSNRDPTPSVPSNRDRRQPVPSNRDPTSSVHSNRDPTSSVHSNRDPTSSVPSNRDPTSSVPSNRDPTSSVHSNRDPTSSVHSNRDPTSSVPSNRAQTSSHTSTDPINCSHIYLFISMHLYSGTTLQHRLQQQLEPRPTQETLLGIFAQIVDAVAYLHTNGLMHRDLKPSNILFDNQDHIRIADFGLATPLVRTKMIGGGGGGGGVTRGGRPQKQQEQSRKGLHTSNVGTELYMSPEQQKGSQYDQKVDIFALGIIFIELMVPLSTAMERVIVLTDARKLRFSDHIRRSHGREVIFVSQLLSHDPKKRPSCEQILTHELLAEVGADRGRVRVSSHSNNNTDTIVS